MAFFYIGFVSLLVLILIYERLYAFKYHVEFTLLVVIWCIHLNAEYADPLQKFNLRPYNILRLPRLTYYYITNIQIVSATTIIYFNQTNYWRWLIQTMKRTNNTNASLWYLLQCHYNIIVFGMHFTIFFFFIHWKLKLIIVFSFLDLIN